MEALIKKLEVKKILNGYYIIIELIDKNGNVHIIDNPFVHDVINFRKQFVGLMYACGSFDLMKWATNQPIPKKVIGYEYETSDKLLLLENDKKNWFYFNKIKKEHTCEKASKKQKITINNLLTNHLILKENGIIKNITSESGTFILSFVNDRNNGIGVLAGQTYLNLIYPFNIGSKLDEKNTDLTKQSAKLFTSFLINLMNFYEITDLLDFGQNKDKLPLVEINIDHNNEISSITNPNTGMGLNLSTKYQYNVISLFENEKQRMK